MFFFSPLRFGSQLFPVNVKLTWDCGSLKLLLLCVKHIDFSNQKSETLAFICKLSLSLVKEDF